MDGQPHSLFIDDSDYQISHTIFCSYCSRDTLMNWSEDKIYPFRPYHDENCYKPHDPNRYFAFFEQEGRFNVTVDHIWKNERDFFQSSIAAFQKSDAVVQCWSSEYVRSYYCYSDQAYAMFVRPFVLVFMIFLEESINSSSRIEDYTPL